MMRVMYLAQALALGKDSVNVEFVEFAGISMAENNGYKQTGKFLNLFERLTKKG